MAPGGVVVVWLSDGAPQIEIGHYQAHDTVVSMRDFIPSAYFDDPKEYARKILSFNPEIEENLSKKGIPYGLWDTYRETFQICPIIKFEDTASTAIQLLLSYFNEEKEDITSKLQYKKDCLVKARLKEIGIAWENNNIQYFANIILKEDEVFNAYKNLYPDNASQSDILIKIPKRNDSLKLYLKNQQKQILLTPDFIEVYQLKEKI